MYRPAAFQIRGKKRVANVHTYIRIYARRQENIRRFFVPRNKILGPANGTRPTNIPIKYVVIIFSFANVSKSMHSLHLHNQIFKKKSGKMYRSDFTKFVGVFAGIFIFNFFLFGEKLPSLLVIR